MAVVRPYVYTKIDRAGQQQKLGHIFHFNQRERAVKTNLILKIALFCLTFVTLSIDTIWAQSVPSGGTIGISDPLRSRYRKLTEPERPESRSSNIALHVAPNPFTSEFTLRHDGASAPARVQIIDMRGRVVESREIAAPGVEARLGSMLQAGTYFIEITQGDVRRTTLVHKIR
jgi:hypothetical protein